MFVCGSHTELARTQLRDLERVVGGASVIDTGHALEDPEEEGRRVAAREERPEPSRRRAAHRHRSRSADRALFRSPMAPAVMRALTVAAAMLGRESALVVTKGGITASDVILSSLGARRGRVRGQVAPGVSVWDIRDGR